jgi:hypothetical protein
MNRETEKFDGSGVKEHCAEEEPANPKKNSTGGKWGGLKHGVFKFSVLSRKFQVQVKSGLLSRKRRGFGMTIIYGGCHHHFLLLGD